MEDYFSISPPASHLVNNDHDSTYQVHWDHSSRPSASLHTYDECGDTTADPTAINITTPSRDSRGCAQPLPDLHLDSVARPRLGNSSSRQRTRSTRADTYNDPQSGVRLLEDSFFSSGTPSQRLIALSHSGRNHRAAPPPLGSGEPSPSRHDFSPPSPSHSTGFLSSPTSPGGAAGSRRRLSSRRFHSNMSNMSGRSTSNPITTITPPTSQGSSQPYPFPRSYSLAESSTSATTALSPMAPLVRDPNHILPVSLPNTPGGSPPLSRRNSPLASPRPSFPDLHAEYDQAGPSTSPRTSISTSSSSRGGFTTRSDSHSSGDGDDDLPIPYYVKQHGSSWWWRHGVESSAVSPKIIAHPSRVQFPSPPRLVSSGTRKWRWLLDLFGSDPSPAPSRSSSSTRLKERETLLISTHPTRRREGSKWATRAMAFVPTTPWGFVSFLFFLGCLATSLTILLKYILDPDKAPLPWQEYCTADYPTLYSLQENTFNLESTRSLFPFSSPDSLSLRPLSPQDPAWPYPSSQTVPFAGELQSDLSSLEPVGVFLGVFSYDAAVKRRNMIRMSYASHWRSRTYGSEGVRMRFIMGRPSPKYRKAVELEMEAFGDIVLLDITENMNTGKTHAFFSWASENATVPYYEYTSNDLPVPASPDDVSDLPAPVQIGERRPQYVVKADDDAFIMIGELERRLRMAPRNNSYWGYLVKNRFMGGQCYGLSVDLVDYIASSPSLKHMTHGKEDKLVSKWMRMHPQAEDIVWVSEKCGIYDHPRAKTVYAHGFLYPSEIAKIRQEQSSGLDQETLSLRGGESVADTYSSVSRFGNAFRNLPTKSALDRVESLVEGSPLSQLRDYPDGPPSITDGEEGSLDGWDGMSMRDKVARLFSLRPTRAQRFMHDGMERGGTVVVHYIKKREWFVETMVAMLGTSAEQHPTEHAAVI